MLYNGCLKFITLGKRAIDEGNMEEKNTNLIKAQNIIRELMVTLNMDVAVSEDMMKLYDFMNRRLIEANMKNDLSALREVEELVTDFRNTWKEAIQMNRKKQFAQSGQV